MSTNQLKKLPCILSIEDISIYLELKNQALGLAAS